MSQIPSNDILESLYKLMIPESDQVKTVLELYDMEIHQKISVPNYQKLKTLVKRSFDQKTSITKLWPGMGELKQEQWSRVARDWVALEEEKVLVTSGKKKASVQETDAVSVTKPKIAHKNQNTLPPRFLSQPYHEVEVCRGREASEAKDPFFDKRADIIRRVPARERLVNVGIRPSANSTKVKRIARLETGVCFHITRLMNNQIDSRRKSNTPKRRKTDDKNAADIVKSVSQLGCASQDLDSFLKVESLGETDAEKRGTNSKGTYASLSPRYFTRVSGKRKDHRWEK